MIIYVIILFLIIMYSMYPYLKHNSKQSRRIFLYLAFITMTIVLGLRGESVGEDTKHYLNVFKYAANVRWLDMIHSSGMRTGYFTNAFGYTDTIENGFLALAKIVNYITDNGHFFLFVVATITCGLFAKFIYDNCDKVVFATLIFLCESMYMLAFNGMRQILAVAISIQAYTFLKNKKWKKAIVIILVASLIHNVALISFVIFPLFFIKPKKEFKAFKYAIIITIASPIIIMLAQTAISKIFPRYTDYFSSNYWQNSLGGIVVLWAIEFILILISYIKKFKFEESFKLSCLILMYIACELMGLKITMFSRVGWFFRSYLIIFFPKCRYYFGKKTWRIIESVIIILLILLYLSYAGTTSRRYSFCW